MSPRSLAALLALTLAVAAAAPATAGAEPRTAAAAAFADAALRAKVALKAQADEYRRRSRELRIRLCFRVLAAVDERYEQRVQRAVQVTVLAVFQPVVETFVPIGRQMVADLDAVRTRDRGLIAGRLAWRQSVELFAGIPRIDRPCQRLAEWRDSGWRPEAAPPRLEDPLDHLLEGAEDIDRNMRIGVRRLRMLGVSRAAARRFGGYDLLDVLENGDFGFRR